MPPEESSRIPSTFSGSSGGVWHPPEPEALQEYFTQYEIVALLGRGGMGAVYKGWQRSLERFVAIKILPPGMDDADINYAERFKQEAKSMAKLMHPGIVAVFDAGETPSGLLYFVMEFVEGTDVSLMVQSQGKLPPEHALAITAHVCDALQYAHTHDIVHRDIKPANIMVNMEGEVKVADFGLAKHSDPAVGGLTKTNMTLGTPDFFAPEALITGVHLDGRADLYAVGVMLYQMLTGTIPRGMFNMPSVMVNTDPRFDDIICKAMQTDREMRYDSAAALRHDLDVILTVPLVQAGDARSSAAIPKQSLPQKPAGRSPQMPQGQPVSDAPPKSGHGPVIGIAATVIISAVVFFIWSKGSSDKNGEVGKSNSPKQEPAAVQTSGDAFIREVAALAPEAQVKRVVAELKRLNPGYDGGASHKINDGKVTEFIIPVTSIANVADISPVRALAELEHLRCHGSSATGTKGKIRDISPLVGLKLKVLHCQMNPLSVLSPLLGMPLERLDIGDTEVSNLSPLRGMPLSELRAGNTDIEELSPLLGLPLRTLDLRGTPASDLTPLTDMKLTNLTTGAYVKDFSVVRGMPLHQLSGSMDRARDGELLHSITSLEFINSKPAKEWLGAAPAAPATTPAAPTAPATPTTTAPPTDAITFNGHRYQLVPEKALLWSEAKAMAEKMGGHLATITSKEENAWIANTFVASLPLQSGIWIGGTKPSGSSAWAWITGEPFTFTNWKLGEGQIGEPAMMFFKGKDGIPAWADMVDTGTYTATDYRIGYLVEWDASEEAGSPPEPPPSGLASDVDERIKAINAQFQTAYDRDIAPQHSAAVKDLDAKFVSAVSRMLEVANKAGQLEESVALRDEITRLTAQSPLPSVDAANLPDSLRKIRATYRTTLAKLETDRDLKAKPYHARRDQLLGEYISELTKQQRLDDALKVRAVRESLAVTNSPAPVVDANPGVTPPTTPPTLKPSQALPALTDEALAATAKWILANRGNFSVRLPDGKILFVEQPGQIPTGQFAVVKAKVAPQESPANSEFAALGNLTTLEFLELHGKFDRITNIEAFRTLTNLKELRIYARFIKTSDLVALEGMSRLSTLVLALKDEGGEGLAALLGKLPALRTLRMEANGNYSSQGGRELASIAQLTRLELCGLDKKSQSNLTLLAEHPNLTALRLFNVTPSPEFLSAVVRIPKLQDLGFGNSSGFEPETLSILRAADGRLTSLGFGTSVLNDEHVRAIVAALPNLQNFDRQWSDSGCTGNALRELAKLPKLKALGWSGATDADCELLTNFPALETLNISASPKLTNACFNSLGGLSKLKTLGLRKNKGVTRAAFDQFKSSKPKLTLYFE